MKYLFIFVGHPEWYYQDGMLVFRAFSFEECQKMLICEQEYELLSGKSYVELHRDGRITGCSHNYSSWRLAKEPSRDGTRYFFSDEWVLHSVHPLITDAPSAIIAVAYHDG